MSDTSYSQKFYLNLTVLICIEIWLNFYFETNACNLITINLPNKLSILCKKTMIQVSI